MRPIAPGERARMQAYHARAMQDRCAIGSATAPLTPCRFVDTPPEAIGLTLGQTPGASIHLPAGTAVADGTSIWLVRRRGEAVTPIEYIQAGAIVHGVLAVVVPVRERQL
jgi:hypothetical protein